MLTLANLVCGFAAIHYATRPLAETAVFGWTTITVGGNSSGSQARASAPSKLCVCLCVVSLSFVRACVGACVSIDRRSINPSARPRSLAGAWPRVFLEMVL